MQQFLKRTTATAAAQIGGERNWEILLVLGAPHDESYEYIGSCFRISHVKNWCAVTHWSQQPGGRHFRSSQWLVVD